MPDRIAEVSMRMMRYFGSDVRRINHALKVYGFSCAIAGQEGVDGDTLIALQVAALLHDIGIKNAERLHNSTAGQWQEKEGPGVARELLQGVPLSAWALERVLFLIGHHHSYNKIDGKEFQILVEADFLVNAYEDEMTAEQLKPLGQRIFRTPAGLELLKTLYPA